MSEPDINVLLTATDLSGVPGLGPVRRRLLAEAGITTRAELAQASLEQIIAATGMPRSVAEQVAEFVAGDAMSHLASTAGGDGGDSEEIHPTVEWFSPSPPEPGTEETPSFSASGEDAPQTTRLERAALRAQTAIADASRRAEPGSKLSEMLVRFAQLTDDLPRRVTPQTRGGILKRVTERIEAIVKRLETIAVATKEAQPLSSKRAKRLQQRLKRTRDSIKRTLKSSTAH